MSIYFPTAANNPKPDVATALVIRPNTPKGASLITIWVIFIITEKAALKKYRNILECLLSTRVSPTPRKIAKKIIVDFLNMIKNTKEITSKELDDDQKIKIMSLSGVKQYPMRVKCATLAWHTLTSAI